MGDDVGQRGFYSVLRWRHNSTRDEAKNVAVVLVDERGAFGGLRHAPVSSISSKLHEQGIVDAVLEGMAEQFSGELKPTLGALDEWHQSVRHSLYFTRPRPTAVPDVDLTLGALYRALIAPGPSARSNAPTKSRVLDQVMTRIRRGGFQASRGSYLGDFLFDAVLGGIEQPAHVVEVLSFATTAKDWSRVEHDAGHFLFAREQVGLPGITVLEPPGDASHESASESFERVGRWCSRAGVQALPLDDVEEYLASLT